MVSRPTVADVAREAGVSVATVDRVVNGRLPVREDTARRVLEAAQQLGFHAVGLIRSRLREPQPEVAVGFLLQRPEEPFYAELTRHLKRAITSSRSFSGMARFDYWVNDDPDDIATRLRRLARRCRAVALVSPDHAAVAAAIADVVEAGTPVFTLLSDCAPASRTAYLGIDSRKAGRTAGWLIRQCAPGVGRVAVIVGSRRFLGHDLREMGFRSYYRDLAPEFTVLDAVVSSESDAATRDAIVQLAERHRDLVGIYLAGGGAAGGVAGLRTIDPNRRPAMICPSLQPEVRRALAEGVMTAAICEPVDRLAERLADAVAQALDERGPRVPNQIVLPMDLYTPENL